MKTLPAHRALLPLAALPILLVGCGGLPLPEQDLNDVSVKVPVTLDANNFVVERSYLFDADPLFAGPVSSHIKDIRVSGTATLTTPAASDLVLEVRLIDDKRKLSCLPEVLGYLLCTGGGEAVGTVKFAAGERLGTVNMAGAYLTELAHAGKGHLGVHVKQGRLEGGSTLQLIDMKVNAKASVF